MGAACGREPPPRIDELNPARVAEVAGRGGLRLEGLQVWFDEGGRPGYRFEVPLILKYGGWNECPPPVVHAATLRDWGQRFGAELVALTGDVVELAVARPPTDRAPGLELAREQYLYCGDIVWQGTDGLETLAAGLKGGTVWFFWWD
jgi:hypothetical protein